MENKQKYLYLGLAVMIFAIYLTLAFFFFRGNVNQPATALPSPTPVPTQIPRTKPAVTYDEAGVEKTMSLIQEKNTLSTADQAAKRTIIQRLNSKSGIVNQTLSYTLRYIFAADVFQAEIKTVNIAQAKENVNAWLLSQRVSSNGICHLPLVFYLSADVSEELAGKNVTFSPAPEGC